MFVNNLALVSVHEEYLPSSYHIQYDFFPFLSRSALPTSLYRQQSISPTRISTPRKSHEFMFCATVAELLLLTKAKTYLRRYILNLPNQEREQFYIMGRSFTPTALIGEIDEGSEVGRILVDQLLDDVLEGQDEY